MENVFIVIRCGEEYNDVTIVDVCATDEIASVTKENWEKENPDDDVWVEGWGVETEMPKKLKDIDDVKFGKERFRLKGSDHIFVAAKIYCQLYDFTLVDLTDGIVYDVQDMVDRKLYDFDFYYKEDDEDYWGVEVIEENE